MRMDIQPDGIRIIPDNPQDHAFIEHVLGLTDDGEIAVANRVTYGSAGKCSYVMLRKDVQATTSNG